MRHGSEAVYFFCLSGGFSILIHILFPRKGKRFPHFHDRAICIFVKEMHTTCLTCSCALDKKMLPSTACTCVYACREDTHRYLSNISEKKDHAQVALSLKMNTVLEQHISQNIRRRLHYANKFPQTVLS